MEKNSSSSSKPETESRTRTLSQTINDDHDSPLHSPSDGKSSPSPIHTPSSTHSPLHSPSPDHALSKAIVPVDYNYPVKSGSPPRVPSPPRSPVVVSAAREGVNDVRKTRARRVRRSRDSGWLDRAALGFRVWEMVLCLVSFSVMAADRTEGWSGDSFDRYKEYRYCLSVTVIAFLYAGLQACSLSYLLITGKNLIKNHLCHHFEFAIDQILAYLLISASSSAATRVDDWQSNWGKDQFTIMATVSVTMSFLAFATFALSSLISGYNLCGRHSL